MSNYLSAKIKSFIGEAKISFRPAVETYRQSLAFILKYKRLVFYVAFFSLAAGVVELVRTIVFYWQYIQFYNFFWNGFSLSALSIPKLYGFLASSLAKAFSPASLAGDISYLSAANLLSLGVFLAAAIFFRRFQLFFKENQFARKIAVYSSLSLLVALPLFVVFFKAAKIFPLASLFMVISGVALGALTLVFLSVFEGVIIYFVGYRLEGKEPSRTEVFAAAGRIFKTLFFFNLIFAALNPANLYAIFSAPVLLSSTMLYDFGFTANLLGSPFVSAFLRLVGLIFLIFSAVFVLAPVIMSFNPELRLKEALMDNLRTITSNKSSFLWLFLGGVLLQISADLAASFIQQGFSLLGVGGIIEPLTRYIFAPLLYSFALLVFLVAIIKFVYGAYQDNSNVARARLGEPQAQAPKVKV